MSLFEVTNSDTIETISEILYAADHEWQLGHNGQHIAVFFYKIEPFCWNSIGLVSLIGPISCISVRSIIYMLVLYFLCIIIELIYLKIWDTIHYILNNLNSYFNANLRILLWHYAYACFSNSCKKKSFRWFTKYSYHFLILNQFDGILSLSTYVEMKHNINIVNFVDQIFI